MQDFYKAAVGGVESFISSSLGFSTDNEGKPRIGIISSYSDASGASIRISSLIKAVKSGIVLAGGYPIEMPVTSISNTLAKAKGLSVISEPAKIITKESVEALLSIHDCDGLVFIPYGESAIKGMLLASAKINLPSLFVNIGPNTPHYYKNEAITESRIYTLTAEKFLGKIDGDTLKDYMYNYLPSFGEGEGLTTANALACAIEVMGLSLKYNGTADSASSQRIKLATETGKQILKMVSSQMVTRKILSKASLTNAIVFTLATGAEIDTINLLRELAHSCGYEFNYTHIAELSKKTPYIMQINPLNNTHFMNDFHNAGGAHAVLHKLNASGLINLKASNYKGESIEDEIVKSAVFNNTLIKNANDTNAVLASNPLVVLYGNIAEKGCLIKRTGMFKGLNGFSGYADVFEDEETACRAVYTNKIKKGSVIVVRNLGDKGAPGKPSLNYITAAVLAAGLENDVAIITDAKSSSLFPGIVVSEISPESYEGEMLAIINDDDVIDIDILGEKLNLKISPKDLATRKRNYTPFIRRDTLPTDRFFTNVLNKK